MLYITRFAEDWRFYGALSLGVIFSICVHEFSHAYAALKQGDPTAADRGHLTLNPLKQMGWWSLIMFAMVGIAWGCVPVDPSRMRHKWSHAWVAAAGPLANLGLFLIFAVLGTLMIVFPQSDMRFAVEILLRISAMNMVLFLLNLMPAPGLDGWTVLAYFVPRLNRTDSEWINGSSLVMLILIFAGIRYLCFAGDFLTVLTVRGLLLLTGAA